MQSLWLCFFYARSFPASIQSPGTCSFRTAAVAGSELDAEKAPWRRGRRVHGVAAAGVVHAVVVAAAGVHGDAAAGVVHAVAAAGVQGHGVVGFHRGRGGGQRGRGGGHRGTGVEPSGAGRAGRRRLETTKPGCDGWGSRQGVFSKNSNYNGLSGGLSAKETHLHPYPSDLDPVA